MSIKRLIHNLLEIPIFFELQQRICNNYEAVAREFSKELSGDRKLCIVDIGCSTGACAGSIIDMKVHDYVGLDVDASYIETARKNLPDGKFFAVDARNSGLPENHFDIAMFIGVMHHMDDQLVIDCVKEAARVLKPQGRLLIAEPVFTNSKWLSTALLRMDRGKHIRTNAEYKKLLQGFDVQSQGHFNFSLHQFCSFVAKPSK